MRSLRRARPTYTLIDRDTVIANWNGIGEQLAVNQNAKMAQTPNGTMIFSYYNQATQNNQGTLSLTSGGSAPCFLNAPALSLQPNILMQNWKANNLSVTNISSNANTPVLISAYGPGVPGQVPSSLAIGTRLTLISTQSAQGASSPQFMQLLMQCPGTLCIFGVIGGPVDGSGNNGYVFALNASENTGPNTGTNPPSGYYATTTSNAYTFQFNWGGGTVYVVNMSPATGLAGSVTLLQL